MFSDEFEVKQQRILKDKHLKMTLIKDGRRFDAIQFNFSENPSPRIRAAFRLDINEWQGNQTVQLMIEHFVPA